MIQCSKHLLTRQKYNNKKTHNFTFRAANALDDLESIRTVTKTSYRLWKCDDIHQTCCLQPSLYSPKYTCYLTYNRYMSITKVHMLLE